RGPGCRRGRPGRRRAVRGDGPSPGREGVMTEWARPIVVDAHCHAGHGDGLTGPWDTDASLDRYRWRARAAGIDRTVLMAALTSDYRTANREVGALVRACPRRYLGYAFVNPVGDRG